MKDEKKTTAGRRDFLRKVGIGAVGAGAAVAAPLTGPVLAPGSKHQLMKSDALCSPCILRQCPIDFRCIHSITVERIVEAVIKTQAV